MPGPRAAVVVVSEQERVELETLTRRHSTPQQISRRAQIVLLAVAGETNSAIAQRLSLDEETVRAWRARWNAGQQALAGQALSTVSVEKRLTDHPRSGRRPTVTAEQMCHIVALTCEAPALSGRPITQWTGREIADEIKQRGILTSISARHAGRLVKKGGSNHTGCAGG